jgi:hypothetical protein
MLYWGIGLHLGDPWPQNKHGHVMGDVTDQGRSPADPTARGNEMGQIRLDYHTDGVRSGRTSVPAQVKERIVLRRQCGRDLHELVRARPEAAALSCEPMPWDL